MIYFDVKFGFSGKKEKFKKWPPVLCGPKAMKFGFVEEHRASFQANRLYDVVCVSARRLPAFPSRPASRRRRPDLVTLAHIKQRSRLSPGRYGRPRMTEE